MSLLRKLVDLEPCGDDVYRGFPVAELAPAPRMFGGAIMAMMTQAAHLTMPPDRAPHALQVSFLTAAEAHEPLVIRVERTFDGGTMAARRIVVEQNDKLICTGTISFTAPLTGDVVNFPMRPDVTGPDSGFARAPIMETAASTRPFDFLEFDVSPFSTGSPNDTSRLIWFRLREDINEPELLACVMAYASDFGATIAARVIVGATVKTPGRFASLNHSLWLHQPLPSRDWILLDFHPIQAAGSRGLVTATLHSEAGLHLATITQEAMMRITENGDGR